MVDEADVEFPRPQRRELFGGRQLPYLQLDSGIGPPEAREERGDRRPREVGWQPGPQEAAPALAHAPCDGAQRLVPVEERARLRQQELTGPGERDATARALEEPYPQLLFEALHALRERRLRHAEPARGTAEV